MKIDFTIEQYKVLINLIYAGNILINGFRSKEEVKKGYEELEYYIYSFAKEFDCKDYVEYDNEFKEYFPTSKFDKCMEEKIYEYNDYVFRTKLLTEIAERDVIKKFNANINEKNFNDFLRLMCKLEKKYEIELEESKFRIDKFLQRILRKNENSNCLNVSVKQESGWKVFKKCEIIF